MVGSWAIYIFASLAAVFLGAAAMLIFGLRGRRVGDEPHCRKCGYNLTGLPEQCPECGLQKAVATARIGVRQRRRRLVIAGTVLLAIAGVGLGMGLYGRARSINWYAHLPVSVLMHQAELDDNDAIAELDLRCRCGTLSAAKLVGLIPTALRQQGLRPQSTSIWAWTSFLAALEAAGCLSREQLEQYRDRIVAFEMEFRPQMRQGEQLTIKFSLWTFGAASVSGDCSIENGRLQIGDWAQDYHYLGSHSLSVGGGPSMSYLLPISHLKPGRYNVTLLATKRFSNPAFTRPIQRTATLEILPAAAPDSVRLVNEPSMAAAFKRAISISATTQLSVGRSSPTEFAIKIDHGAPVPIDAAFEFVASVNGQAVVLFDATFRKRDAAGRTTWHHVNRDAIKGSTFTPNLRTSVRVAKMQPDMFEIWDGEIAFPPVQVPPVPGR